MTASVRVDDLAPVRLGATPIDVRPDGYRVYRGTATYGDVVLPYPEFGGAEFRPAAEVLSPEAVASMVGVPFTIHHPDDLLDAEDEDSIRRHQVGTVLAARVNKDVRPPALEVEVIVHQRSAQRAVESGELAELSPGYRCHDEPAPPGASHAGQPYQVVQRRHRYNHLSGVLAARTVLPDGRRARLDEASQALTAENLMSGRVDLRALAEQVASGTYPPTENASMADETPANDTPADAQRTDAADPSVVLARFTPEDAAILKTLSPEGLAMLAEIGASALAVDPAAGAEAVVVPGAEVEVDAAPSGGVTMDMVTAAINDALAKAGMAGMKKADADAIRERELSRPRPGLLEANAAPRLDADAIIARAAEEARRTARMDADLVAAVRRDGHDVHGYDSAVAAMLAVVERHTPRLLPRAREDLKAGRMDAVRAAYETAEDRRRDAAVEAQADLLRPVLDAAGDGHRQPAAGFRLPERGAARTPAAT